MGRPKASNRAEIPSYTLPENLHAEELRFRSPENHRLLRESVAYLSFCTGMVLVVFICVWIVLNSGYTLESQKWASTTLTTLVSAGVGYLTGKAQGKAEG